jgi:metallo-beta-lactamase class B
MFARTSALLCSLLLAGCAVAVPLQSTPPQIERLPAPIAIAGPAFAAACKDNDDWDKPAPPVRIHGNTYLVGTCGISSILVTSPAGHVLIDGGTEKGAELIAANIRSLGFRLEDVKYLLHSHEHLDHVGGTARLQQLTGAQLLASPPAAKVFATGAPGGDDPQAGMHAPFRAARVDRVINEGDTARIGGVVLTPIATPGHTPGALSWSWTSCEEGVCRRIVLADSLSPISSDKYRFSDHPAYVKAYRNGLAKLADWPCDILLTPHPSASKMIDRFAGRAPLVNTEGCRAYALDIDKRLDERLAKEQGR